MSIVTTTTAPQIPSPEIIFMKKDNLDNSSGEGPLTVSIPIVFPVGYLAPQDSIDVHFFTSMYNGVTLESKLGFGRPPSVQNNTNNDLLYPIVKTITGEYTWYSFVNDHHFSVFSTRLHSEGDLMPVLTSNSDIQEYGDIAGMAAAGPTDVFTDAWTLTPKFVIEAGESVDYTLRVTVYRGVSS